MDENKASFLEKPAEPNSPSTVIHFAEGIPGFEDTKDYALWREDDTPLVMTLQALNAEHPGFVVIDPFAFVENYTPRLASEDLRYFDEKPLNELLFLTIVVLHEDMRETIVNLKSPLVIDPQTNLARQVFLENPDYSIRTPLFQK